MTIGIQGGKGSFSEQAAHNFAHNHGFEGAEIIEFGSKEEVLIKTQFSGSSDEISERLSLL